MFSDAISSISWRCLPSSPRIAAARSGSASVSGAVKNESGAEAVLTLEDWALEELMGEISPPPQAFEAGCGRSCVAVESCGAEIPYRATMAKHLRYEPDIYPRYGGQKVESGRSQVAPGQTRGATPPRGGRLGHKPSDSVAFRTDTADWFLA